MPKLGKHNHKHGHTKHILLFISVTVIWGGGFLITNDLVHAQVPVLFLTAVRFAIGSGFLALFRLFSPGKAAFSRAEWKQGFLLGLVIFAAFALQTYGALYTTPGKNGMLTGLHVIFVPLLLLHRRKMRAKPFIDAGICLVGVMILSNIFGERLALNLGDILVIFCALVFAVQFLILEKHAPTLHTLHYVIAQLATVAAVAVVASLLFEMPAYARLRLDLAIILKLLFLGLLSTGYAYIVQTFVQTKLPATTVSLLSCLESVFAVIFSLLFGYEAFSLHLVVGALVIAAAMVSALVWPGGRRRL
ncbi:MAG: DMT family transporter [Clostridiales bacterium]|nr:DMT family transporter [Clostridiales bacterium]